VKNSITLLSSCCFLLAILSTGCRTKENNKIILADTLRSETDTFYLGNQLIRVERSSAAEFERLPALKFDTLEANNLLKDSVFVKRNGDTLFFRTQKGLISLTNSNEEEEGDDANYATFTYLGYIKEINQFVAFGSFYEWYNYILVDGETGDTTYSCGLPIVAPGKKHFMAVNADLEAAYTYNGFELYENVHPPRLIASRELTRWGPNTMKWKDDKTIFIDASVIDTTKEDWIQIGYFKLILE